VDPAAKKDEARLHGFCSFSQRFIHSKAWRCACPALKLKIASEVFMGYPSGTFGSGAKKSITRDIFSAPLFRTLEKLNI
jgi:hypothetical protein